MILFQKIIRTFRHKNQRKSLLPTYTLGTSLCETESFLLRTSNPSILLFIPTFAAWFSHKSRYLPNENFLSFFRYFFKISCTRIVDLYATFMSFQVAYKPFPTEKLIFEMETITLGECKHMGNSSKVKINL